MRTVAPSSLLSRLSHALQRVFRRLSANLASTGALLVASMLGATGCQTVPSVVQSAKDAIGKIPVPGKPAQVTTDTPKPVTAPRPVAIRYLREDGDSMRLFRKGVVTGRELLTELKAIRTAAASRNVNAAMSSLFGTLSEKSKYGKNGAREQEIEKQLLTLGKAVGEKIASDIAFDVLDKFLSELSGDQSLLQRLTVELPKDERLDRVQRQQILVMAALIVGAKASNEIVLESHKDFESLRNSYKHLLDKRRKAAEVFAEVTHVKELARETKEEILARGMLPSLGAEEDIALVIDAFGQDGFDGFIANFGIQNLALSYLNKHRPEAVRDYRIEADRYVNKYQGYLRATAGAGTFAAFASAFYRQADSYVDRNKLAGVKLVLPYAGDLLVELAALGKNIAPTASGIAESIMSIVGMNGGFDVQVENGKSWRNISVPSVADKLNSAGVLKTFSEGMFENTGKGYMRALYECDRGAVAGILDRLVSLEAREQFFVKYFHGNKEMKGMSFTKAFDNGLQKEHRRQLIVHLLERESSAPAGSEQEAVESIQRIVEDSVGRLERKELARMIFSSSRASLRHASIRVGAAHVSVVPDEDALFAYESFAKGCVREQTPQRPKVRGA